MSSSACSGQLRFELRTAGVKFRTALAVRLYVGFLIYRLMRSCLPSLVGPTCWRGSRRDTLRRTRATSPGWVNPFTPTAISKSTLSQHFKERCISEVVRIVSIIIYHLSKLWKATFFILCGVVFLMRLQEKFELDHCWPGPRRGRDFWKP